MAKIRRRKSKNQSFQTRRSKIRRSLKNQTGWQVCQCTDIATGVSYRNPFPDQRESVVYTIPGSYSGSMKKKKKKNKANPGFYNDGNGTIF